jgi:hypothetical protein
MKVTLGDYNDDGSDRITEVQIDPWDTYSLDYSLALIIHPALVAFRANLHGWPSEFESCEDWEKCLDKMIFAFEALASDTWEDQYYLGDIDWVRIPLPDGSVEVSEGHNSTFTIDREGLEAHSARINEGLELFGKHFRNLWD